MLLVSVITTSYNSASTIHDTIESVNSQSYTNIEHILIDGLSSDETVQIFSRDSQYKSSIVSEKDRGIYHAMNKGIKLAKGEVIFILNSDDVFFDSSVVQDCVKLFENHPSIDLIYGSIQIVDKVDLKKIKRVWNPEKFTLNSFRKSWHPPHPGVVVRRRIYQRIGGFDENFKIASDYDWLLSAFEVYKVKTELIARVIVSQREGGSSMSLKGKLIGNMEVWRSVKKHGISIPFLEYFFYRYRTKLIQKFK